MPPGTAGVSVCVSSPVVGTAGVASWEVSSLFTGAAGCSVWSSVVPGTAGTSV